MLIGDGVVVLVLTVPLLLEAPARLVECHVCGYNDYMARGPVVGSRELKTHLGRYLQRVRRGEVVLVTDRHEPVAELRPIGPAKESDAALRKLAAAGAVTLPTVQSLAPFGMISARGKATATSAVSRDRDERG
jgi:prevent-host-death family protein